MLIDLSVRLNEKTPVYPGDPKTKIETAGKFEKDGYRDHYVCVGTHVGTHMDAPSHMIDDGANLDSIPLERFTGRGIYVKIGKSFGIAEVQKADIREGDIVLFHTGMSDRYHESAYYESYPAISEDIAHYLVEKKIKIVGVDMCSPDYPPFPAHRILLAAGILIIENLTNLEALAGKEFRFHAYPIKLELDGVPVRVVAEV